MKINIPLHTILFTVAPSGSGKTHFLTEKFMPLVKEKYPDLKIKYLSSDDYRRYILDKPNLDKMDNEMIYPSSHAFNMLDNDIRIGTSWDVKQELIIVDTTGMNKVFIEDMVDKGKKYHYNVIPLVFEFKKRNDYYLHSTNKSVTTRHLESFKSNISRLLSKKKFKEVIKIKSHDVVLDDVTLTNYDEYKEHLLDLDNNYVVISDIHGCYNEFIEILETNGCTIENGIITENLYNNTFIIQDYIDKNSYENITNVIEFITNNRKYFKILVSNHENFVYKIVNGILKINDYPETLIKEHFQTIGLLNENEDLKNKFNDLFTSSKHFYEHRDFIVNHAPCSPKYIGKMTNKAFTNMRNYSYEKRITSPIYNEEGVLVSDVETLEEYGERLSNILKETILKGYDNPFTKQIIWGHISLENSAKYKNINFIDTGCYSGGKLTSINIDKYTLKTYKSTVNSIIKNDIERVSLFNLDIFERVIDITSLDRKDFGRIKALSKNKINFISGTMTPANKNEDTNVLEDLSMGLDYYKNNNIDKVILEKKYMGSSSQIYLFRDVKKCYSVSRNGFIIDNRVPEVKALYQPLIDRFEKYMNENDYDMIILNGELLPWVGLGDGLVYEQYKPIIHGIESEYDILLQCGFFEKIKNKKSDLEKIGIFEDISSEMTKEDIIKKYNQNNYEHALFFTTFEEELIEKDDYDVYSKILRKQIDTFTQETPLEFKPFGLLKAIKKDKTEVLFFEDSNIDIFKLVSDDEYHVVDFSDENYLEKAQEFYEKVSYTLGMEGIVIKPEKIYTKNILHAIKVRNPNYLTITYGFDYLKEHKYNKLISKKSIKGKIRASLKEFEYGKKMLEIPYEEISDTNDYYNNLCYLIVINEKETSKLDPRL